MGRAAKRVGADVSRDRIVTVVRTWIIALYICVGVEVSTIFLLGIASDLFRGLALMFCAYFSINWA